MKQNSGLSSTIFIFSMRTSGYPSSQVHNFKYWQQNIRSNEFGSSLNTLITLRGSTKCVLKNSGSVAAVLKIQTCVNTSKSDNDLVSSARASVMAEQNKNIKNQLEQNLNFFLNRSKLLINTTKLAGPKYLKKGQVIAITELQQLMLWSKKPLADLRKVQLCIECFFNRLKILDEKRRMRMQAYRSQVERIWNRCQTVKQIISWQDKQQVNNKQKQMSDEDSQQVLSMSLHRRRFSLFERNNQDIENNHREVIRNKYRKFIETHLTSRPNGTYSPKESTFSKTEPTQLSMPSIRIIRQQNVLIGESLRKTISRYNYVNHEKQKKLLYLHRKKLKYQHILKVREEHYKLKKSLNQSLVSLNSEITEEKLKLKRTVEINRAMANESRIQIQNQKRMMGKERRQEIFESKSKIKENKSAQLEACKKLHQQILSKEKELKVKKQKMAEEKKNFGTHLFCLKLKNQVKKFTDIEKAEKETKSKLSPRVSQLERSRQIIDSKLKNYEKILKDGSTLKKNRVHLKVKGRQKSEREENLGKSKSLKDEEEEQESFN